MIQYLRCDPHLSIKLFIYLWTSRKSRKSARDIDRIRDSIGVDRESIRIKVICRSIRSGSPVASAVIKLVSYLG